MKNLFCFLAANFSIAVLLALNSRAADYTVHMTVGWTFSPNSLVIQAGDTVTWINSDDSFFHDATSSTGLWATGSLDFEESKTLSFDTPGTYPYLDTVFHVVGMTGTIQVNAAPPPPPRALLILPAVLPNGAFRFTLTNLTVGTTNIIEGSTNLLTWTARTTNVAAGTTLNFTNSASGFRFFRSRQTP